MFVRRSATPAVAIALCFVLVASVPGGVIATATASNTGLGLEAGPGLGPAPEPGSDAEIATGTAVPLESAAEARLELAPSGEAHDLTTETNDTDGIVVDEEIPETGDAVEVVVRFEEASVADVDPGRVDTRLEDHADDTQEPLLEYAADAPAIDVEERFWLTNAVVLEVDPDAVDLETFGRFEAVEAVHENFEISEPEPTSDLNAALEPAPQPNATATATTQQRGAAKADAEPAPRGPTATTRAIARLNAPAVWNAYDTRGAGTRVAVLDTGIDPDHPALELYTDEPSDPTYPGGWAEFDATGERVPNSTPHDTGIHGTHVSGTVAGVTPDGTAIGVAPEAELLHGLVLSEGNGTFAQAVAGMEWALGEDADVISMSLGSTGTYPQFVDPVRNARASGTVVVGAIGNEGAGTSGSPGNVYETISVGAIADDDSVADFSGGGQLARSNWSTAPDTWPDEYVVPTVVAPGVDIVSAVPGGYARLPGTSMATPHVTGTIALLLSIDPDATPEELSIVLTETAWKPDVHSADVDSDDAGDSAAVTPDPRYGYGIVDSHAAADALVERDGTLRDSTDSDATAGSEPDTAASDSSLESAETPDDRFVWLGRIAIAGLAAVVVAIGALVGYSYRVQ